MQVKGLKFIVKYTCIRHYACYVMMLIVFICYVELWAHAGHKPRGSDSFIIFIVFVILSYILIVIVGLYFNPIETVQFIICIMTDQVYQCLETLFGLRALYKCLLLLYIYI